MENAEEQHPTLKSHALFIRPSLESKEGSFTSHVNATNQIIFSCCMQWGRSEGRTGEGRGALTAVVWEEPSEGKGEGGGVGAGDHGGRRTHAAGHHGGRRHVAGAQVSTWAGRLICGRVEGKQGGRQEERRKEERIGLDVREKVRRENIRKRKKRGLG